MLNASMSVCAPARSSHDRTRWRWLARGIALSLSLSVSGCAAPTESDDGPIDLFDRDGGGSVLADSSSSRPIEAGAEAGPIPSGGANMDVGGGGSQSDGGGSKPDPALDGGKADSGSALDSGNAVDGGNAADGGKVADGGDARDSGSSDSAISPPRDGGPIRDGKKFVGNITTSGQVRSDFASMWNQITPENEGKWSSVEGTRNQMNWSGVDRVHDYAKQHGILFKQHTFVWGSQQPSWIAGLPAAQQRTEVEEWIRLFCERYPDVEIIDVVNEPPPHTTPPYLQAIGGAGASQWDWIVQAFKWTRQYCPSAILVLNDYNNIEYADQNAHFIEIVKAIKAAGAPIDAVGAQAHAVHTVTGSETIASRTAFVKGLIDKLASETGLPVYITEYDIDEPSDDKQKQIMQAQFTMFWNHTAVKGITLWGYVQGATWQQNSGLMSASGVQRPALTWLVDFLKTP
jgi:endo-1,4-beta-xylanase